jgi:hypothetical protein
MEAILDRVQVGRYSYLAPRTTLTGQVFKAGSVGKE